MQFDTRELTQLAQTTADNGTDIGTDTATPRVDMYAGIHKALRAAMCDALVALGKLDTTDQADLNQCAARVTALLHFCSQHVDHENQFVHTAMEARAPGSSGQAADDHVGHKHHIALLQAALDHLVAAHPSQRERLALHLYRELALFVADNFTHMHTEETAHNAALWAHYSDAELVDLHNALVGSIPPEEMMAILRWLVPSMNPGERVAMLSDMRANAPAPAFDAALGVVRPHLSSTEWAKLDRGLGLDLQATTAA